MSDIENDFDKVIEQINAQIVEAAKAMTKANELASKAGLKSIASSSSDGDYDHFMFTKYGNSYYDPETKPWSEEQQKEAAKAWEDHINLVSQIEFGPLFNELVTAGWSTSSMFC
jgi:hypothetical protein